MTLSPSLCWVQSPGFHPSPVLLLSAGNPQELAYFREKNPWAISVPLVLFGTKGTPILDDKSGSLHSVLGFSDPLPVFKGEDVQGKFTHIAKVARLIASRVKGPVWEVCADATFGFLAIGAASGGSCAIALADTKPGIPSSIMADLLGVDIDVGPYTPKAIP